MTHSSSNMAIMREASGFEAICGIWRNSSRSIEPEPSLQDQKVLARTFGGPVRSRREESSEAYLSSFINRFLSLSSSADVTEEA